MCAVFQGVTGEADGQPGPRLLTIPRSPADLARNRLTFRAPVRRTVHERLATDRPAVPRARRSLLPVDVRPRDKDPDTKAFEKDLSNVLGLKVEIKRGSGESGNLVIKFGNFDQLDYIRQRLGGG